MNFKDHFGLDIGSTETRAVWVTPVDKTYKLLAVGSVATPEGSLDNPVTQSQLAENIKKLIKDSGISTRNVCIALPESQVITRVIETPVLSEQELENAIKWEAEQYVPVPMNEVTVKYQILSTPEKGAPDQKMDVLLVAAPNNLIGQYLKVTKQANLEIVGIETEILAISRAVVTNDPYSPTSLILNLGSGTTDLSVIKNGGVSFVRSISTGGEAITRAISSGLNMDLKQAEEYKKTYGLDSSKLDGQVAAVVKPVFEVIVTEIKRGLSYFQTKKPDDAVKRVVLSGGMAQMPGIIEYLAESLTMEVQVGNPLINITKTEQQVKTIAENAPAYTPATGLALREG